MGAMEVLLEVPMSCEDKDVELVRRVASGDEDALRALWATYGQRLYAYALHLTGDSAAAEEVVQDSLVAAWQGARRFRGESRAIAWLLGIVHHKALNALRSLTQQRPFSDESTAEIPSSEPSPDEQAVRSEQSLLLKSGLDRLSLEHRTVLELVFYQGLSLSETAEVCGCPMGTVKSRLSHAKSSLRGALYREGLSAEDLE
jgi:RNA polymerase sigma-70 factor (ECF subfamily)